MSSILIGWINSQSTSEVGSYMKFTFLQGDYRLRRIIFRIRKKRNEKEKNPHNGIHFQTDFGCSS